MRRRGETAVAVYIPLEVAEALEVALPKGLASFGAKLAKTKPELFAPLLAAGWRPTRARAG